MNRRVSQRIMTDRDVRITYKWIYLVCNVDILRWKQVSYLRAVIFAHSLSLMTTTSIYSTHAWWQYYILIFSLEFAPVLISVGRFAAANLEQGDCHSRWCRQRSLRWCSQKWCVRVCVCVYVVRCNHCAHEQSMNHTRYSLNFFLSERQRCATTFV